MSTKVATLGKHPLTYCKAKILRTKIIIKEEKVY